MSQTDHSAVRLIEKTTTELASLSQQDTPVIVPVGAVTQYGPHLPVGTNVLIGEGLAEAAAERAACLVAPTIAYGYAYPRPDLAGNFTIWPQTLQAYVADVLASLDRNGFRRIILFYAQLPNITPLNAAAQLHVEAHPEALVAIVAWWQLAGSELGRLFPEERGHHAMSIETSLVAALHRNLVREGEIVDDAPLRKVGYDVWPAPSDTHSPSGVHGSPSMWNVESGTELAEVIVEKLAALAASPELIAPGEDWNLLPG